MGGAYLDMLLISHPERTAATTSVSRETLRGRVACIRRVMGADLVDGEVRPCAIRGSADLYHHLILSGARFRTPPHRAADTGGVSTTSPDHFRSVVYLIGRTPHSTALSRSQTSSGTADTSAPSTTPRPRTGPAEGVAIPRTRRTWFRCGTSAGIEDMGSSSVRGSRLVFTVSDVRYDRSRPFGLLARPCFT
jgi:hypothetical protein